MKHSIHYLFLVVVALLTIVSCSSDDRPTFINDPNDPSSNDWLVPRNQVFDGGVGRDGIPSVDNPSFTKASEVNFLDDNALILGIKVGDVIKGYPHPILDWHEVINDEVGNEKIALTYCPLTGTGIGWDREINGKTTEFGVSGLLYNTNLIPYDRETNSNWSQQRLECVNGELIGSTPELHSFIETSWVSWLAAFPDSEVLNRNTGFSRDYNRYPYGNYRSSSSLISPVDIEDDRLHPKERVLGVQFGDEWKAYTFADNSENVLLEDEVNGNDAIIISNAQRNFIVAFKPKSGATYSALSSSDYPAVLADDSGNRFDILGQSVDSNTAGLELHTQFIGYWFSWGAFYPDLELEEQ